MSTTTFGVWDYLVFGLMLAASICIGIYHAVRGKNQTTSDYLVAGRSMTFLPVALSLVATYNSSIMMLGTPAESYVYGFSWILNELGTSTGILMDIILATAFVHRLNLSTPFEYFERRFQSRSLRLLANGLACLNNLLYMSMVLYAQAIALQAGISFYGAIVLTAGIAISYTTIGGLKAVIWTDALQFLIMFSGMFVVAVKGTVDAGGAGEVWTRAAQSGRLDFSLDVDPTIRHTVWNLTFGRILSGLGLVFEPATLQRLSSTKSLTQSRRALLMAVPGISLIVGLALTEGIVAFGFYSYKRCDPLVSKQIESPNQIIPFMIMDLFQKSPGLPGLFLAAMSSASLSTISSCLSAISIITWYDLFKPCWPNMSDVRGLLVAKITVLVYGAIACIMAVLISLTGGSRTLNQISSTIQALTRFPVVGLFYLGALFPFVNAKGAITGFVTGVLFMGWLVFGSMFSANGDHNPYYPLGPNDQCPAFNLSTSLVNMTTTNFMSTNLLYNVSATPGNTTTNTKSGQNFLYSLSYTLYSSLALCVVMLTGTFASLITGGWNNRADPELVIHMPDIHSWYPHRQQTQHVNVSNIKHGDKEVEAENIMMTDCPEQDRNTVDFMSDLQAPEAI